MTPKRSVTPSIVGPEFKDNVIACQIDGMVEFGRRHMPNRDLFFLGKRLCEAAEGLKEDAIARNALEGRGPR